jgi:M6 family metalloprotease-like protein
MRKRILVLPLMLCFTALVFAVPAFPSWHVVTQSDGTTLKVHAVGNAFNNAILTDDGLSVARGDDGDFYYYSSLTGLTAMRAHESAQRTATEKAFIAAQRGNLAMSLKPYKLPNKSGRLNAVGNNAAADVPAQGERRIPIILVEFQDKKFNNSREKIVDAMLTGNESVGQYFFDQSNGKYKPVFDVYGIYCLSQDREYYGGHSGTTKDKGIGWLVTEACKLAAADGVSFSPYDTNNDYYCDVVIIIFAGVGESQASMYHPEAIWPCNWTLDAAKYYSRGGEGAFSPNNGDPYINNFAVFNELHGSNDSRTTIDGIGTFVHEFGHCLGLPDFYDTGNNDNYGMGNWDIMCKGCYANDGYSPVGYSAYEKVFMGWVDYIKPVPNTYYTLSVWNQKNVDTDQAVCITSDLNKNEYFIFENRQRVGWDRFLPGQGLMVTHITYSANAWTYNKPNNEKIQLVTLLPADNKLSQYTESYDLWPYGNRAAVTDESTPSTTLNMDQMGDITGHAGYLGKPVTEIVVNRDGTISFWYMKTVHNYTLGDVDHDGTLSINDVTVLIDYLLGSASDCCVECADVDKDANITIEDVTILIDILLAGNSTNR